MTEKATVATMLEAVEAREDEYAVRERVAAESPRGKAYVDKVRRIGVDSPVRWKDGGEIWARVIRRWFYEFPFGAASLHDFEEFAGGKWIGHYQAKHFSRVVREAVRQEILKKRFVCPGGRRTRVCLYEVNERSAS